MKRECCICKKSLASEIGMYLYPAPGQQDLRVGALFCKSCGQEILEAAGRGLARLGRARLGGARQGEEYS